MAASFSLKTERRRPAEEDICFLDSKSLRLEAESSAFKQDRKSCKGSLTKNGEDLEKTPVPGCKMLFSMETSESSDDDMGRLDIDLDRKSRQHNLTSRNVRAILHEVITHEHVVAMMKETIRDTQNLPMFEPKMTRSRLKQVIQQEQSMNWSLNSSAVQPPQFVDIELEDDEDSSDEEYCPEEDEDEEDDTNEEFFLSDGDSFTSPPRPLRSEYLNTLLQEKAAASSSCPSQQLLPAPDSSFLERLNAVEEELDSSPAYYDQSPHSKHNDSVDDEDDDDAGTDGGCSPRGSLALRTRSKLQLVNVPLGQLEAKLLAPDITADMYELNSTRREEDRHWTKWLQGLMGLGNEEDADDEDDPEYNVLEDLDEPDVEDYRTDRAVQITKKEVNELLEELFDTLQEEETEEQEAESNPAPAGTKFNVPKALRFEAPLASMLTERRRVVRRQYEAVQQKRALQDTTNQQCNNASPAPPSDPSMPLMIIGQTHPTLQLNSGLRLSQVQKLQLQQQIQQHVQLLTQVHLLARRVEALNHESSITKHYLEELQQFSQRQEEFCRPSIFRACNLRGALDLLQEMKGRMGPPPAPPPPAASKRWLPAMTPTTNSLAFPLLPADLAWIFATRSVFLYPELVPVSNLSDMSGHQRRNIYTPGEDGLIVLALKHFEGTLEPDQLITSYLIRKTRWNFRKHVREMSSVRAPPHSVIKMFTTQRVVPPLPLACCRVQPGDQRPPVDKRNSGMPNWLKNSQIIIQKTRLNSGSYSTYLPSGVTLRLHPQWLSKTSPRPPKDKRLFKLAHNASLLPLAKAPVDRKADAAADRPAETDADSQAQMQPLSILVPPAQGVVEPLALPRADGAAPAAAACPPCSNLTESVPIISQQSLFIEQNNSPAPLLLPLPSVTYSDLITPIMPCSTAPLQPGYFVMVLTPLAQSIVPPLKPTGLPVQTLVHPGPPPAPVAPPTLPETPPPPPPVAPTAEPEHAVELRFSEIVQKEEEWRSSQTPPTLQDGQEKEKSLVLDLSPLQKKKEQEEMKEVVVEEEEIEKLTAAGFVTSDEGEKTDQEEGEPRERAHGGGVRKEEQDEGQRKDEEEQDEGGGERENGREGGEGGGRGEENGGQREDEGGDRENGGEKEDGGDKEEDGGGDRDEDGEKDEDQAGEEEEEEDFDDLTQDEDEEEVMSSASEESVLSVPELQETMKQLTWLAAEQRLCADGDSEEDHSPTSPGSQEEEEEEEEEGPKGEELGDGRTSKEAGDEDARGEGTPRGGGSRRGRGRSRPLRGLRRGRQERHSIDAAKLLLLYDENIVDNDPHRESKDAAFAQSYLNRVREALQETPAQVGQFVSLLSEFEHTGGQQVVMLFRKLRCILGDHTDLLREFAAFLQPDQALLCGLFEEQQAFERSRRFLRQLEISFGENPSHYQKIIKALQTAAELSPNSISELKTQMATLLKGHTHLQNEFWVFFDELRPPPAHPGQFEEAQWPEDGSGGVEGTEGFAHVPGGGTSGGFEEVTLPELEEEEEGPKVPPMTSRRQRRKMDGHRNYKGCDWLEKDWPCICHDSKIRRYRRKGCSRCHSSKASGGVSKAMKSLNPLYAQIDSTHQRPSVQSKEEELDEEELDEEEDEDDEEERRSSEKEASPTVKRSRRDETPQIDVSSSVTPSKPSSTSPSHSTSITSCSHSISSSSSSTTSSSVSSSVTSSSISSPSVSSTVGTSSTLSAPPRPSPPPEPPVCAKNISLTASGEKVILWTREADRVILTTCQQEGANQNTFQAISTLLGNKTPEEVSRRFEELMCLFRTAARQTSTEEEAPPLTKAANEGKD